MACCNEDQQSFILSFVCFVLATFLLWRSPVFKAFKLFAVLLHEFSHATAATLCCGRVTGIEVSWDEGGLCTYSMSKSRTYSIKCTVLPAGYLGSTFWGCGLVLASAWPAGAKACGVVVLVVLAISFLYAICGVAKGTSERCLLIGLCIFFGAIVGTLTVLDFSYDTTVSTWALETALILIGTVNMMYATYDIYDDTIRRSSERSDAYQYATLAPCLYSRCVGVVWFFLALAACVASAWGHVKLVDEDSYAKSKAGGPPCDAFGSCMDWYRYLPGPLMLAFAVCSHLVLRLLFSLGCIKQRAQISFI